MGVWARDGNSEAGRKRGGGEGWEGEEKRGTAINTINTKHAM